MCVYDKYMYVCVHRCVQYVVALEYFINSIVNNTNQKHKNLHKIMVDGATYSHNTMGIMSAIHQKKNMRGNCDC